MVIDTVVFAYALLGVEEFCEAAAKAIERADEIWVPDSLRAELVNVVWQWVHLRGVPIETGQDVLQDAETLFTKVVPTQALWEHALELAVDRGHPAYDTLFIALAIAQDCKVITYDRKLLSTFPEYAISVSDYLNSG